MAQFKFMSNPSIRAEILNNVIPLKGTKAMHERKPILLILEQIRQFHESHMFAFEEGFIHDDFEEESQELLISASAIACQLAKDAESWLVVHSDAQQKLLSGELLDADEFNVIQTLGSVFPIELGDLETVAQETKRSLFDCYRLFHYEDDEIQGLIGTDQHEDLLETPTGRIVALFRIAPEEIHVCRLTDEQKELFRSMFPDEFSRMNQSA
jgi:hypothetical protein